LYAIHQTLDGNYMAAGSSNSGSISGGSGAKDTDFAVIKIDASGAVLWSNTYDFGKTDLLISLSENKDGTLVLGGYSKSQTAGSKSLGKKSQEGIGDYIALKISADGEELWDKSVGSTGEDILKRVVETRDGGYLMAGTSVPAPSLTGLPSKGNSRDRNSAIGGNDFWVVKLLDRNKAKKAKVAIEAIPNPAQQFTNVLVGYDYNNGTATVFDLGGRLLQHFDISGNRTIPVDLSGYPEGIYLVQVKTDVQMDSVKVMKGINN
ncbi:MAG: T9SS type A sorting domain-containing protein, partial [Sphingobacteriales bacterium]